MAKKKKRRPADLTPTEEYEYRLYALTQLTGVLSTLGAFKRLCATCAADKTIQESMLRDLIVLYGSVFKSSAVSGGKYHKLDRDMYVPKEYKELHDRLIQYRDKLVAHFDFDFRKPEKRKAKDGTDYYMLGRSPVPDLRNELPQIEDLTKKVLMVLVEPIVSQLKKNPGTDPE